MNRPQRIFHFLRELTAISLRYGVVIEGAPELEFRDDLRGQYCLNPNNEGPEFGWNATR